MQVGAKQFYEISGRDFIIDKSAQDDGEAEFYQRHQAADINGDGLRYEEYLDYLQTISPPLVITAIPKDTESKNVENTEPQFFYDFINYAEDYTKSLRYFDSAVIDADFPKLKAANFFIPADNGQYLALEGWSSSEQGLSAELARYNKQVNKYDKLLRDIFRNTLAAGGAELRNNEKLMLAAVKFDERSLRLLGDDLRGNPDFILKLLDLLPLRMDVTYYETIPNKELRCDADFFLRFAQEYPYIIYDSSFMSSIYRGYLGAPGENIPLLKIILENADGFFEYNDEDRLAHGAEAAALIPRLADLNINYWERFHTLEVMQAIYQDRLAVENPTAKPVVLVLYNKSDYNDAFQKNQFEDLLARGYAVFYYEVTTDTELFSRIKEVGAHNKIDLLIVGGHGQRERTLFGNYGSTAAADIEEAGGFIPDEDSLDLTDIEKTETLEQYMKPNASVSLESCETGEGESGEDNMANFIYKLFNKKVHVFAPTDSTFARPYRYDDNNKLIDIEYESGKTYHIAPEE
ncbi:hypothetical protein HP1_042 [Candidatus Termititenax spirochaetophilus]|uniref:Uncharacterized protein n=1 Tax=Candidatus Termititenax spirochaetophilus TaxID=2218522 RepID=A0A388T6K9_9BACT|nr:hypothetical protein HP1_042 [Candidatus Termititenax spirochaetophilus]